MSVPTQAKVWVLQNKPEADIDFSPSSSATFVVKIIDIPSQIPEDSVLVKPIYLSNDPAQRTWIQKDILPERLYVPPVNEGEVMRAAAVARVIKVGGSSNNLKEGNLVVANSGWAEYAIVKKDTCRVVHALAGLSPSVYIGMFGVSGLTAYFALREVLKFQPGESIVISGAAGAVGNVAVQLAKHVFGAKKVVAVVGTEEKAKYVKRLGADIAVNYKSPNFKQELTEATCDFVETYFDNVGGEILDFMLTRLKRFGRIAACGATSAYNNPKSTKLENYFEVITNRLQIRGFAVLDYFDRLTEGISELQRAYKEKKLVEAGGETVVKASSFEEIPKIWYGLFEGKNQGKLVTEMPA